MRGRAAGIIGLLFVLGGPGSLASRQAIGPDPDPGQSAISGVVADGTTHAPLQGVTVSLYGPASIAAVTDSKGRFVFRHLKAGSYRLTAEKGGYAPGAASSLGFLRTTPGITVGKKEWIADLPIAMWRLGGISGVVRDEAGEPVVGVPVRALIQVWIAGHLQWAGGTASWTDDRGVYRLAGLRRGRYVICVPNVQTSIPDGLPPAHTGFDPSGIPLFPPPRPSAAQPSIQLPGAKLQQGTYAVAASLDGSRAYPTYFYPNARTLPEAIAIEIGDGEERRNVDVAIQPVRAHVISGRLVGAVPPLDWFLLRLVPGSADALSAGIDQAVTTSKGDGTFVLPSVPEGSYTLVVTRAIDSLRVSGWSGPSGPPDVPWVTNMFTVGAVPGDFALGSLVHDSRRIGPWLPGRPTEQAGLPPDEYSASVPFELQSDVIDRPIELQRSAVLSGRIVRDDGQPMSTSGPTAGRVSADPANGSVSLGRHSAPIDAEGRFTIDGLKAGDYFLRASTIKSIAAPDGDHTDRPFSMTPGASMTDIVITVTSQTATLFGEVRDRNERVPSTGAVVLFPVDSRLWQDFGLDSPRIRTSTFVGQAGYQIERIPAGEYFVIALDLSLQNAWQEPGFFARLASMADRVKLQPGEKKVLSLHQREVIK